MSTAAPFDVNLPHDVRGAVASTVLGLGMDRIGRSGLLDHYFLYYEDETTSSILRRRRHAGQLRPMQTHDELLQLITEVKLHPERSRQELIDTINSQNARGPGERNVDLASALDLVARVMLMVSCFNAPSVDKTGLIMRPPWNDSVSLAAFIKEIFPRHSPDRGLLSEPIKMQKLKARYLERHAKTSIEWTDNLPDHLHLQITDEWKTLRVFGHAGFLEAQAQALASAGQEAEMSVEDCLRRGCLPQGVVIETLKTILLLFPEEDERSRKLLSRRIRSEALDPRLDSSFAFFAGLNRNANDLLPPEDVQGLFKCYPHWGKHLYRILKEVEDPTPLSWVERWSDSRKNPRYAYRAAMITLIAALCFGIVATILAALQVWISWKALRLQQNPAQSPQ